MLKVNSMCLIHGTNSRKWKIIKQVLKLREYYNPSYFESRKLLILLIVMAKLCKMFEQGILKHIPPDGSKWKSLIIVLRKSNGDLRICGNYKISVNYKICLDSYLSQTLKIYYIH